MEAEVSNHGFERGRERIKLSKKAIKNLAQKALDNGITHTEAQGALRKFFDSTFLAYGKGNNIRIYAEKVFIFDGNFLITVYQLPSNLKKIVLKAFKKRGQYDH